MTFYERESALRLRIWFTDGNPAFKLYDVDPGTYEVMDAKVFDGDLTQIPSSSSILIKLV